MSVFVLKRGPAERPPVVAVEITGNALGNNGYILVDGVKYTAATAGIETAAGKTIVFRIYGTPSFPGCLYIDGVEVASYTNKLFNEYEWVIPDGVTAIVIDSTYGNGAVGNNNCTVTTS